MSQGYGTGVSVKHPTERGSEGRTLFDRAAEAASNFSSSPTFFTVCGLLVAAWAASYLLGASDTLHHVLADGMAALTLMLVALLKNAERRAGTRSKASLTGWPRRCSLNIGNTRMTAQRSWRRPWACTTRFDASAQANHDRGLMDVSKLCRPKQKYQPRTNIRRARACYSRNARAVVAVSELGSTTVGLRHPRLVPLRPITVCPGMLCPMCACSRENDPRGAANATARAAIYRGDRPAEGSGG
jgi:hypothetical protein